MAWKNMAIKVGIASLLMVFTLSTRLVSAKDSVSPHDFGAYYTRIQTGVEWELHDRSGAFADIIVDLGRDHGKFVFWRGSSFLPYWENAAGEKFFVDEIIPRQGDGDDLMPDKVNTYSHVALIESSDKSATIHWRYLQDFGGTNPHLGVLATNFVDEYFTITSDGLVRRSIRTGTEKSDEWNDPDNRIVQEFRLTQAGFVDKLLVQAKFNPQQNHTQGVPIVQELVTDPAAWFKFDEATGDLTRESKGGAESAISGDKTVWKKGVSGTALQFDGYKTTVKIPATEGPEPAEAITLEAWVAIGAYPWSWCPIIQQADDVPEEVSMLRDNNEFTVKYNEEDDTGYFLGIDGHGHPGFKIKVGGVWEELATDIHLERRQWYHIAATYSQANGKIMLYVNGQEAGEKRVAKAEIELSSKEIQIGRGKERRPTDPVRENTFPGSYSFDGLIDEVKIYDQALSQKDIRAAFSLYTPGVADLDLRVLPEGEDRLGFGGYYSNLKFYDSWDNLWRFGEHSDVVVEFDNNPCKFIFWKGVSYIPMMVNENKFWYSNEFNETWGTSGGEGCQEPMSDKQCLYNHVRIIENSPARVLVHYRFPLVDVNKIKANYVEETGWYDVADWYYYIYPDGVAAKTEHLWTSGERNHEWQESMAIFGPDQHPHDLIEREETFTMVRIDSAYKSYDWNPHPPKAIDDIEHANIQHINYKGEYDPVTIVDKILWSDLYSGEITEYAIFPTWNHWPVAQMPSDGRYASYPDRTCHSSLSHIYPPDYDEEFGNRPYQSKIFLEGMLKQAPLELVPLARSWIQAPGLSEVEGCTGRYNRAQRAYVFEAESNQISMSLLADKDQPVENVCMVFKHWNSKNSALVLVDGKESENKQGIVRDTDGSYKLVLWLEKTSIEPFNIEVNKL